MPDTNKHVDSTVYSDYPHFSDPLVLNLLLSPVIDGDFLPDEPSKLFHNAAKIDYMAGVNDMDGHIFTSLDVPTINSQLVDTPM